MPLRRHGWRMQISLGHRRTRKQDYRHSSAVGNQSTKCSRTRHRMEDLVLQDFCAEIGAPIIDWLWDGFNALLLGYGQTGTGKTHCLFGGSSYGPASEHDGLLHHILLTILERSKETRGGGCTVGLQCWEVQGEKTVDLLRGDKSSATGKCCYEGLWVLS